MSQLRRWKIVGTSDTGATITHWEDKSTKARALRIAKNLSKSYQTVDLILANSDACEDGKVVWTTRPGRSIWSILFGPS